MVAIICIVINMIIAWVFIWDSYCSTNLIIEAGQRIKNIVATKNQILWERDEFKAELMEAKTIISRKNQKRVKGKFA